MKIQDPREQLSGLQEDQLFSLARNESAQMVYRKTATYLLKEKASLKADHPEIAHIVAAFMSDLVKVSHESEVAPVVEKQVSESKTDPIPEEIVTKPPVSEGFDEKNSGPFKASVTTLTMSADPVIE